MSLLDLVWAFAVIVLPIAAVLLAARWVVGRGRARTYRRSRDAARQELEDRSGSTGDRASLFLR